MTTNERKAELARMKAKGLLTEQEFETLSELANKQETENSRLIELSQMKAQGILSDQEFETLTKLAENQSTFGSSSTSNTSHTDKATGLSHQRDFLKGSVIGIVMFVVIGVSFFVFEPSSNSSNSNDTSLNPALKLTTIDATDSSESTIDPVITSSPQTTIASNVPTWTTVNVNDFLIAPFAQAVCDILETWRPPAETSARDVQALSLALSSLDQFIGQPSDFDYSDTYFYIALKAKGALDYERKYPTDKRFGFSFSLDEDVCSKFGFNASNSQYGINPFTGNLKGK